MSKNATAEPAARAIVSSESEQLILVDSNDNPLGVASKGDCHDGQGTLHRAFSLFIFNDQGELLLQQRSPEKRLWGGYWSNSCCSHPRAHESMEQAVHRRLEQELGMAAQLRFVYKFEYQAQFGDLGAEHELCWVYLGRARSEVRANVTEVSDWRYVSVVDLEREMGDAPGTFTPWFKMEWSRLNEEFAAQVREYSAPRQTGQA